MSTIRVNEIVDALGTGTPNFPNGMTVDGTVITIASQAQAESGTGTGLITSTGIRHAFNATGTAPVYACRAWVNFNGTGTVAILGSGNVSSITDNGVGLYTINFTTAMPDANYVAVCSGNQNIGGTDTTRTIVSPIASLAGSHQIQTGSGASSGRFDFTVVSVSIFG